MNDIQIKMGHGLISIGIASHETDDKDKLLPCLTIRPLKEARTIGDSNIPDEAINEHEPCIHITFDNIESVDVVLTQLNVIKTRFEELRRPK